MHIHGNQLLRLLHLGGDDRGEELDHLLCMIPLRKVEIQTILGLLDVDGIAVSVVLEDELLKVQKGSLVRHLLAQLNAGVPSVDSERLLAVRAL